MGSFRCIGATSLNSNSDIVSDLSRSCSFHSLFWRRLRNSCIKPFFFPACSPSSTQFAASFSSYCVTFFSRDNVQSPLAFGICPMHLGSPTLTSMTDCSNFLLCYPQFIQSPPRSPLHKLIFPTPVYITLPGLVMLPRDYSLFFSVSFSG